MACFRPVSHSVKTCLKVCEVTFTAFYNHHFDCQSPGAEKQCLTTVKIVGSDNSHSTKPICFVLKFYNQKYYITIKKTPDNNQGFSFLVIKSKIHLKFYTI